MKIARLAFAFVATLCLLLVQTGAASAGPINYLVSFDYPGAGNSTLPRNISNSGNVVGSYSDSSGVRRGFERFSDGTFSAPIVHPNDTGNFTRASGSNTSGTIVGDYFNVADNAFHGYFLNGGTFTDFNISGPFSTALFGINDSGDAVGVYGNTGSPNQSFFLPNGGGPAFFTFPGSVETDALAVNNLNETVGLYIDGAGVTYGFFRDAGGLMTAIDVPGAIRTAAFGINDQGWIVGNYTDSLNLVHGFILMGGVFMDVDYPGGFGTRVFGVNNDGFLVGDYLDSPTDTLRHGFIAQVVPEPASVVLLGAGVVGLGLRRVIRRRKAIG